MGLLYDLIFGVFVLTALLATFGNYLDKKFHTSPALAIIFGITAIIFGLARLVIKSNQIYKNQLGKNENKDN
ncbi:MAG: hypothetical protein HY094_03505 [Candidatus Melainabacteria bacterium]|nr:hypothetical protein [Candidatus Melainabacteria bacterium]